MNEPKATSSWSPAQRRLPLVAGARLRFFVLLALLVPLFGGLHALLTAERAPQVEVRFVPQAVPVIVEVPVERVVEVPVERVVDATATPTAPAAP